MLEEGKGLDWSLLSHAAFASIVDGRKHPKDRLPAIFAM
jgi:hypothetical protein